MLARFVAILCNASGRSRRTITAQDILGRPLRKDWADAQAKKEVDALNKRLAEKDAARRRIIIAETY